MTPTNRVECPNCGSFDTERVHQEDGQTQIEEVRICDDCPAQFTNQFVLRNKKLQEVVDE